VVNREHYEGEMEGGGGYYKFSENLFVVKINFCTATAIVVLVLLNSG